MNTLLPSNLAANTGNCGQRKEEKILEQHIEHTQKEVRERISSRRRKVDLNHKTHSQAVYSTLGHAAALGSLCITSDHHIYTMYI